MFACLCLVTCNRGGNGDHNKFSVCDKVVCHPRHQNNVPWLVFPLPLHRLYGSVYKIQPHCLTVVQGSQRFVKDLSDEHMSDPEMVKAWVLSFMCQDGQSQ